MGDAPFFARAMDLARGHRTHPNPRVGALLVDAAGTVVGEGAHLGPGTDHAEVVAIRSAGDSATGSTLYVTLEPCSHHGLTPPCVDAIIAAGIKRVEVGGVDPDPRVQGNGLRLLAGAGIEVGTAVGSSFEALDPGYFHHRRTGLPLVTLKYAMTMDGSAAAADGTSQWITGEQARADAHLLRSESDAVVIGAGTLRLDDPTLDVRHGDTSYQPRPVVIAGEGELPEGSRLWARNPLVISAGARSIPTGELVIVDAENSVPAPRAAAAALADRGLYDVLLEGGPVLAGAWWRAGLVARAVVYVGGKLGGGVGVGPIGGVFGTISESREVAVRSVTTIGPDVRIEFE